MKSLKQLIMMYVVRGGIVGIYSSGTKTRQKAQKWPNGDYFFSFRGILQDYLNPGAHL